MKKLILFILIVPTIIFGQYWGERTTEQSFEQSDLYFKNNFLNTFGAKYYKDIAVGMINDPFLNIELNPAYVPQIGDKEIYVYLDFRGDRTEPQIVTSFVSPEFDSRSSSYIPSIDRRWFSKTRTEPQPLVSLGIITFPLENLSKKFYIGGTYQLMLKEESYYSLPFWIYNSQYYYDSFGNEIKSNADYNIITRYSGNDKMVNEGHLYSAFTGYKYSDDLSFGLSINGVSHSRKGNYSNMYQDSYYISNNDWNNSDYTQRSQEYSHFDVSAGVIYNLTQLLTGGLKFGLLSGGVDQNYVAKYSYFNKHNIPEESPQWSINLSNSSTEQTWNHDGNTYYFRPFFKRKLNGGSEVSGYYRYAYTDIDAINNSTITDTSFYASRWNGTTDQGSSSVSDIRRGIGYRNKYFHEAMLNFKWKLSKKSILFTGIYFNSNKMKIYTSEPVIVKRFSNYEQGKTQGVFEDKRLEWKHEALDWTLQIPIILDFDINENFNMMIGINRIFESWDITDVTTAYFNERRTIENGVEKIRKNFGERYFQPDRGITEDHTDIVTRFEASPSPALKISLLLDPEFEDTFRIAQWWLSFKAGL